MKIIWREQSREKHKQVNQTHKALHCEFSEGRKHLFYLLLYFQPLPVSGIAQGRCLILFALTETMSEVL